MLLMSRHLPGLALASALTLIGSVAAASPINLAGDGAPTAPVDTGTELQVFIEGIDASNVPEAPGSEGAMDDFVGQEPLVAAEPNSLVLTGLGLTLLLGLAGRHWLRRHNHHHRHRHRLHRLR
jgi:hypothetical protein